MDHTETAEMNEPVSLNGHREADDSPEGRPQHEPDRGLVYEILREFRALSTRDE